MNPEQCEPIRKEKTWVYPWVGILSGIAVGIFVGHPLSMMAHNFQNSLVSGAPLDIRGALFDSFLWHMWPMTLIFALFGGITWGFMGFIYQRLRENRLRLDASNRQLLKQTRYLNTYLTVSSMVSQCLVVVFCLQPPGMKGVGCLGPSTPSNPESIGAGHGSRAAN